MEFYSLAFLTSQKIQKHIQIYNNVLEIVINKNPKAITELIPMGNLKAELNHAESMSKKEFCEFPIEIKIINIMYLLKVSEITTILSTNSITISLNIPTFYKNDFILNTGIPIPFNYKNTVYVVRPNAPYFLTCIDVKTNNTYAISMSLEDRNKCIPMPGKLLCYPNVNYEIIKEIKSSEYLFIPMYDSCNKRKLRLLKNLSSIPNGCNVKRTSFTNKIIQLEPNKFYLHLINPSKIKFDCHNRHSTHNISESMVLDNIPRDCSIQFDNGFHAEQAEVFLKSIFLHSDKVRTYSIGKHELAKITPIKIIPTKTLRNLQHEFSELQEQVNNITPETRSPNYDSKPAQVILTFIVIIALALTCAYIFFIHNKLKEKQINIQSSSPTSMDTLHPEINCHFKFGMPPSLPPKTRSRSSMPQSPGYDYPKSSMENIQATIEKFNSPSILTISKNANVTYASIQKPKLKEPITQV